MATNDPLRAYLRVQTASDRELASILEQAARDARAQIRRLPAGMGSDVRRAQLNRVITQIKRAQAEMWTDGVSGVITRGRQAAVEAAQDAADALTHQLYARVPQRRARALERSLNAQAREGMNVEPARVRRDISRRVLNNSRGSQAAVDRIIRSALVRGLSADELSREVYQYISPTTPGGASYAAMRLARTEINNAFHARQIAAGQRPGVIGIKWNLSGSHTRPDQCNVYANKNHVRKGVGVFSLDSVPDKPHPQCLCFITYEMQSADDFAAAFLAGDFDAEINARLTA